MRVMLTCLFLAVIAPLALAQDPTPQETERTIRIWWPDGLYDLQDEAAQTLLKDQIDSFNRTNPNFEVEFRLKASASILSTLTAAQPVAPSAIPDLVMIPRRDLLQAVRNGVIRPVDDWVPDTLRADLLTNTLPMGKVDDILYGVPYAVVLQHLAYQVELLEEAPHDFASILAMQQRFALPGMPQVNQETSDILLAQYVEAGGRLVDTTGVPTLDQEPLLEVLAFYEEGLAAGIFSKDIILTSQPSDYWGRFLQNNYALALIDSSTYLQADTTRQNIAAASIPTVDGKALVIVDGWLWALTTVDPDQQRGALEFMEWMMGAEAQADYTQAIGVLPARKRALRLWADSDYITQVNGWMQDGVVISVEQRNNTAAQQLQSAFEAVLNGTPYDEAVNLALTALSGSN